MTIEPNTVFKCWTVDEVAECMEGVSDKLYDVLWNKVDARAYTTKKTVFELWDQFTEEQQKELNSLEKTNPSLFHWLSIEERYDAVEKSQCK